MRRVELIPAKESNQIDLWNTKEERVINDELNRTVKSFRKLLLKFDTAKIEEEGSFFQLKNDILQVANLLIRVTNQHRLPIDLTPIHEKMLIHSIVEDLEISSYSASLTPDETGFVLKIEKTSNEVRDRAIIAHEIGHTLFYDVSKLPPSRILRYRPRKVDKDKEEWVSWDFARELLLPRLFLLRQFAFKYPLHPSKIVDIARKTGVSVELLCHRLILDLGLWNNCAFFVSDVSNGRLRTDSVKVYRTSNFPRFFIKGKKGLVNENQKISEMVGTIVGSRKRYDHGFIKFQGFNLWVKMLRYFNDPQRVLCLLEIPFANLPFNVLPKRDIRNQ